MMSKHPFSTLRRRAFIWILSAVTVALPILPALAQTALPTEVPPQTRLVIADQYEYLQTLMRASGEQQKLKADVSYANFQGGPAVLEAFRAGALDLAIVYNTPPIQAHASGLILPIVAVRTNSAPDYYLAVRPGLRIDTLAQLKGHKIAYAEGTGRQPFVLSALKAGGLGVRDVTLVPLHAGDFPTALQTGQVDVAALTEPYFSRYLHTYADQKASALPKSEYAKLPTHTLYLYASPAALADPAKAAAIREVVQHWVAASVWSQQQREAWVDAYYVRGEGLTHAEGLAAAEAEGAPRFPRMADAIKAQQATIDLIHEAGDIPKRLDAAEEFDLRFDAVTAEAAARLGL
jgi:sulfonate transport system substrate-binding protein